MVDPLERRTMMGNKAEVLPELRERSAVILKKGRQATLLVALVMGVLVTIILIQVFLTR